MAIINFYDDIFDKVSKTDIVYEQKPLSYFIESYLSTKENQGELKEVYNAQTDKTEYRIIQNESYKAIVLVNNEEKDLDFIPCEDDVISILFVPMGENKGQTAAWITGTIFLIASAAMAVATAGMSLALTAGTATFAVGSVWAAGIVTVATAAVGVGLMYAGKKKGDGKDKTAGNTESSPGIQGAENESIIGNRVPFIMGKHLMTPYIVGAPYHDTHVRELVKAKEGEDGQQFHIMYLVGYGPLKLTNFKLGDTVLAYNQSSDFGDRKTVLHGQLRGCDDADTNTVGDFTKVWKNNDIKMEILQAGNNLPEVERDTKYGTIYPVSVNEKEVGANILYVYDKMIEDVSTEYRIYHGTSIPLGFRGNTVRFSDGCPFKLQVELDMNEGFFASKTSDSNTKYKRVPLNLAVQWRFAQDDEEPSDSDDPSGWNTFDYAVFDYGNVGPVTYSSTMQRAEISSNKGLSSDTPYYSHNPKWIGAKVFALGGGVNNSYHWEIMSNSEIVNAVARGEIYSSEVTPGVSYLTTPVVKRVPVSLYPYTQEAKEAAMRTGYGIAPDHKDDYRIHKELKGSTLEYWIEKKVWEIETDSWSYKEQDKKNIKDTGYNVDERRYVFEKTFSEEECRKMVNFRTGTNYLDNIEVRVIRLTPCYLDETGVKTPESYQDLVSWTYLRSYKFNKTNYINALNDAYESGGEEALENVSVDDYHEMFASSRDLDKICFVGLQLKQDVQNTAGSSLNKFSCIAQSFNPKYDEVNDKWYPEKLNETFRYYRKYKNADNKTVVKEFETEEEYEEAKALYPGECIKKRSGNDFTIQVREDLFQLTNAVSKKYNVYKKIDDKGKPYYLEALMDENVPEESRSSYVETFTIDDNFPLTCIDEENQLYSYDSIIVDPMVKYTLSDEMERKYISSNTASIGMLSIVGNHLGPYAKTYDSTDLFEFADFFNFCKDITDGTKQNYLGIKQMFNTSIDLTGPSRVVYSSDMIAAGYNDFPSNSYGTIYSYAFDRPNGDIWVVSPIKNDGTIVSKTVFMQQKSYCKSGSSNFDESLVLAKYTGGNAIQNSERYAILLHRINSAYYEANSLIDISKAEINNSCLNEVKRIFDLLKDIPINALREGIYTDLIKDFNHVLSFRDGEEADPIYESYIIDILEQTLQEGQSHNLCKESDGLQHVAFNCNGVVSQNIKMEQLLQKIFVTGRAYVARTDDNKFKPLIGRPNPYPVTVLNQRNCLSKNNVRLLDDLPSGYQVTLIDEDDNYGNNDFYVMNPGEVYDDPIANVEQFSIDYVTDKQQAANLTRFNLACKMYQRESYSRTVGMSGLALALGDTVLLQDDSLLIGTDQGGRIVEIIQDATKIYGFTTDEPFEYTGEIEDDLCIQGCTVVQASQYKKSRCVTFRFAKPDYAISVTMEGQDPIVLSMKKGLTNTVLFEYPILKDTYTSSNEDEALIDGELCTMHPKTGDLVAFGKVGTMTSKAVITSIKPKDKFQFDLSLVPYNEDLYQNGYGIPIFNSNMDLSQNSNTSQFNFSEYITQTQAMDISVNIASNIATSIVEEETLKTPVTIEDLMVVGSEKGLALTPIYNISSPADNFVNYSYQINRSYKHECYADSEEGPFYSDAEKTEQITLPLDAVIYDFIEKSSKCYYYLDSEFTSISVDNGFYTFNRSESKDYYPEKSDLQKWAIRVKGINAYGNISEEWCTTGGYNFNLSSYGTYIFNTTTTPEVNSTVSGRSIRLELSYRTSQNIYGNIKYIVLIKREKNTYHEADTKYYTPDLNSNAYDDSNEDAYKLDTTDGVSVISTFTQVLPLAGQSQNKHESTWYAYKVYAYNEISQSATKGVRLLAEKELNDTLKSEADFKNLTVEKNLKSENVQTYVIFDGKEENSYNYWQLNDDNTKDKKMGSHRFGNKDQYFNMIPVKAEDNSDIFNADIKVHNLEIEATKTDIAGVVSVADNSDSDKVLNRTRITPSGTYYERRESENGDYEVISKIDTTGVVSTTLRSNTCLTISNTDQSDTRKQGHDIGRAYLSENALIWHFDNDKLSQNGEDDGLVITGTNELKGSEDSEIYAAALIAKAPYSSVAKSIYGTMSLSHEKKDFDVLTYDFWMKYEYASNKNLFDLNLNGTEHLTLLTPTAEIVDTVSGVAIWENADGERIYTSKRNPTTIGEDYIYFRESYADEGRESDYKLSQFTYDENYVVTSIRYTDGTTASEVDYNFISGEPDDNWEMYTPKEQYTSVSIYGGYLDKSTNTLYVEDGEEFYKKFNNSYISVGNLDIPSLSKVGNRYFVSLNNLLYKYDSSIIEENGMCKWDLVSVIDNKAAAGDTQIKHTDGIDTDILIFNDEEARTAEWPEALPVEDEWMHIAIIVKRDYIRVYIGNDGTKKSYESQLYRDFERKVAGNSSSYLTLNSGKTSLLIDELYIDEVEEPLETFKTQTFERIPWGKLPYKDALGNDNNWFIFDAANPENVKSNILEALVKNIADSIYPVGYIYTQYPGKQSPVQLKLYGNWEEITSQYAGLFFRAEGGDSAEFGETQDEGLPNIAGELENNVTRKNNPPVGSGVFSDQVSSTSYSYGNYSTSGDGKYGKLNFDASKSNDIYGKSEHVTPVNTAIRIWQRMED